MPQNFKSKAGGLMAGHADKWSDDKRRPNSFNAGAGSKGSRNQGTGQAGKANTVASAAIDTSKMNQEDKLKYFKSLGLMPGQEKPKPQPEPVKVNPVKELTTKLSQIYRDTPDMLMQVVTKLKEVPQENLKQKAVDILNAMKHNNSTNPHDVQKVIMSVFDDVDEVDTDIKTALEQPTLEKALEIYRVPSLNGKEEIDTFIKWVADEYTKIGVKPSIINRTISHYNSEFKNNWYKFLTAKNAMIDNAGSFDPNNTTEFKHNLSSFESGLESYDAGDITPYEKSLIQKYNNLHN